MLAWGCGSKGELTHKAKAGISNMLLLASNLPLTYEPEQNSIAR